MIPSLCTHTSHSALWCQPLIGAFVRVTLKKADLGTVWSHYGVTRGQVTGKCVHVCGFWLGSASSWTLICQHQEASEGRRVCVPLESRKNPDTHLAFLKLCVLNHEELQNSKCLQHLLLQFNAHCSLLLLVCVCVLDTWDSVQSHNFSVSLQPWWVRTRTGSEAAFNHFGPPPKE